VLSFSVFSGQFSLIAASRERNDVAQQAPPPAKQIKQFNARSGCDEETEIHMLSRSLGSKSSAAASAAPSSGRKSIPVLLAALQQCSSIDKQNAAVAIKRLAAAVDAEPDMRCNYLPLLQFVVPSTPR
jgi:hypothetical protein